MGHGVRYVTGAGERRFEEVESLDAALARVERLQDDHDASDVRVYRQVPIEVRTYYKVVAVDDPVVAVPSRSATQPAPDVADQPPPGSMPLRPAPVVAAVPAPGADDDDGDGTVDSESGADGSRRSLFGRG